MQAPDDEELDAEEEIGYQNVSSMAARSKMEHASTILALAKLRGGVPHETHEQLRKRMAFASKRKQIRMLTELDQKNSQIYRRLKEIETVHETRRKLKKQLSNARATQAPQQRQLRVALRNELSGEDSITQSGSLSPGRGAGSLPEQDQAM